MRARFATVVALSIIFLAAPLAHASRLSVKGTAQGGGTSVNNGSVDVGTNDGTSTGNTTLWTDLGFASAADLTVFAYKIPNEFNFDTVVLENLRAIATVPLPFTCAGCENFPLDKLDDVKFGSDLGGSSGDVQNVAWFASLKVVPTTMVDGQTYQFTLGAGADADKLDALIALVGGQNIHIGLAAALNWSNNPPGKEPGVVEFATPGDLVPEPASLILLGSGLVGLANTRRARRKRHAHSGPAAPDKMKLPQ